MNCYKPTNSGDNVYLKVVKNRLTWMKRKSSKNSNQPRRNLVYSSVQY